MSQKKSAEKLQPHIKQPDPKVNVEETQIDAMPQVFNKVAMPPDTSGGAYRRRHMLSLQGKVGNAAIQRFIAQRETSADEGVCPVCGKTGKGTCDGCGESFVSEQESGAIQRTPADVQREYSGPGALSAEGIYDALDGWNDEAEAIEYLRGTSATMRQQIDDALWENHDMSIRWWFKDQMDGDWLIKGFAARAHGRWTDHHTAVALALIPTGTRDDDLNRILYSLDKNGRQRLESQYNETFGRSGRGQHYIGEGSLVADMKGDLSGWRLEKSLAMLDRDLTNADKLYFDSVGITGTHDTAVIQLLQKVWDESGPQGIQALEQDWNRYIKSTSGWGGSYAPDQAFTGMSLREGMSDELSLEAWELVSAILRGARHFEEQIGVDTGPLTPEQQFALEDIRLEVANDTLIGATTGDSWYEGAGTNEEQVYRAIQETRRIWQGRISRAEAAGNAEQKAEYETQWNTRRQELVNFLPSEMNEGSADHTQARLTLLGDLTLADQFYIAADLDYNYDKANALVTKAWQQGKIDEFNSQCSQERKDASDNTVLRPSYRPWLSIGANHGAPASRVMILVRDDWSDGRRGAERIRFELEQGNDESDLARAYGILSGATPAMRAAAIESMPSAINLPSGEDPKQRFLSYISTRYSNSHSYWEFLNLLDPSQSAAEIARRARGQEEASHSGLLNVVTDAGVYIYDTVTAEDSAEVVDESLDRLDFIANASEQELAVMMAITGIQTRSALSQLEHQQFQSRLKDVRSLKTTITDAIATVIEIAVDLALTAVTGGGAAGLLVASLGAAITGMIVREALQGQNYDLMSEANFQQLVLAAASAGLGQAARPVGEVGEEIGRIMRMGEHGQAFIRSAAEEGFSQANQAILQQAFSNRMPTAEELGTRSIAILGQMVGAGRAESIFSRHGETMRTRLQANIQQELIAGFADESGNLVINGANNLSGTDIAGRFAMRVGTGIRDGAKNAARSTVAGNAQQRRQREQFGDLMDDPDTIRTPEQEEEAEGQRRGQDQDDEAAARDANLTPEEAERARQGAHFDDPEAQRRFDDDMDRIGPVNEETRDMLARDHDLRAMLAAHPQIVRFLKLCNSPCLPQGTRPHHVLRFNAMIDHMDSFGFPVRGEAYQERLRRYFHAEGNADMGAALDRLEQTYKADMVAYLDRMVQTSEGVPLAAPASSGVTTAMAAVRNGNATRDQWQLLMRKVVSDYRAYRTHDLQSDTTAAGTSDRYSTDRLTAETLRMQCGTGRDISAESLKSFTLNSPDIVRIDRFQARDFLSNQNHSFAVVTLPDGSRYLIDPTASQFLDPNRGSYEGERVRGNGASLTDASFAAQLVRDGMIPLDHSKAQLYAEMIGGSPEESAKLAAAMVTGQQTRLTEQVSNGNIIRSSDETPQDPSRADVADLDSPDEGSLVQEIQGFVFEIVLSENVNNPVLPRLHDLAVRLEQLATVTPIDVVPDQETQ